MKHNIYLQLSLNICTDEGKMVPTVVTNVTDNKVCMKGESTGFQWNLTDCVEITEQNSCSSTHTVVLDTCNYTMNVALPPGWCLIILIKIFMYNY